MRIHSAGNLREGWEMKLEKLSDLGWAVLFASIGICCVAMAVALVVGTWRLVLQ